ncbi:MAG: hypothetical protein CSA45_01890 [Gammaproteobacteria bacterium]|nr:MAG: hypothetical protein CSA45_01890 [Gammaproteobacteria bacterium]
MVLINILKTSIVYLLAFFLIIVLSYLALQALPGDPIARLFADYGISEQSMYYQRLQQMYEQHTGWQGFLFYCHNLLHGEFGFSISYSAPVSQVLADVMPWTWLLTLVTAPLALSLTYFIGIEAALHHGKLTDILILMTNNIVNALPSFVKAVILFFIFLQFFPELPLQGAETPMTDYSGLQRLGDIIRHLIAPVTVLLLLEAGKLLLPIRAAALSTSHKPYVSAAKLRGVSRWRLRHAYIGSNIRGILIVRGAMMLVSLLTGSVFVEIVFSYPGIGLALYQSIGYRDYALIQAIIILLSLQILLIHCFVDIVLMMLNRRG